MGREQGRLSRTAARWFRERQIYHRSDGIVRFVKLTTRTQMALAAVVGAALLWVAYASVNVVFKEQIIVSKETERRNQEAAYRRKLQTAETAYDEVNALNFIYQREFDATVSSLRSQHETLRGLVENKSVVDARLRGLAESLSVGGAPGGQRMNNAGRLMVDPVGREPTPRQSRIQALREEALRTIMDTRIAEGIDDEVLATMRAETAALSAQQVVLMASLEEDMRTRIEELNSVLDHTDVATGHVVEAFRMAAATDPEPEPDVSDPSAVAPAFTAPYPTAQGGPFIPADDDPLTGAYYRTAERVSSTMEELIALERAAAALPIGIPVAARHRVSSRFGKRWDPIRKNRRANHRGLDFAAPRNTPLLATAPGRVVRAGTWGAFGRTVEIDHGNGFKTRFAHLNKIKVRKGQRVELGDTIGLMGTTGRSTGVHLHYEVLYRGRQVNPQQFIEAGRYVFES